MTKGQELRGIYRKLSDGEPQEDIVQSQSNSCSYHPCICSPPLTIAPFVLHLMMSVFRLDLLPHLPKSAVWYSTSSGGLQMVLKGNGAKMNNTKDTHIYPHDNLHSVHHTRAQVPQILLTKQHQWGHFEQ